MESHTSWIAGTGRPTIRCSNSATALSESRKTGRADAVMSLLRGGLAGISLYDADGLETTSWAIESGEHIGMGIAQAMGLSPPARRIG